MLIQLPMIASQAMHRSTMKLYVGLKMALLLGLVKKSMCALLFMGQSKKMTLKVVIQKFASKGQKDQVFICFKVLW